MEKKEFQNGKSFYGKVDESKLDEYLSGVPVNFVMISQNFIEGYEITIDLVSIDDVPNYRMWINSNFGQGQFNYASLFEAYADLYRVVVHDLEFKFEDGWLTEKIYKYKEE